MAATTVRGTIGGMAQRANPAFAVGAVGIPVAALLWAVTVAGPVEHTYVHVMAGVLWTGIDLFMALVLGPVLGGLSVEERASVFERFTPKTAFLLPALALVTIGGGVTLAPRVTSFPNADPWLALFTVASVVPALLLIGWQFSAFTDWRWLAAALLAGGGSLAWLATTAGSFGPTNDAIALALGIVALLNVQGFGVLMPGEVRIYREMTSAAPDADVISTIGMRNARLSGLQGVLQLAVVAVMVSIRFGGF